MRIAIDLDRTICYARKEGQSYLDVEPLPGAAEAIKRLKSAGHYIVVFTARGQISYNNDKEKISKEVLPIVAQWLLMHGIPFDQIDTKILCDIYVDDRAIYFDGDWEKAITSIENLGPLGD